MLFARCRRSFGIAVLAGGLCLTIGGCSIFVPHVKPEPLLANDPLRVTCAAATTSELTKPRNTGDAPPTMTVDQQRQNIGASVMRADRKSVV